MTRTNEKKPEIEAVRHLSLPRRRDALNDKRLWAALAAAMRPFRYLPNNSHVSLLPRRDRDEAWRWDIFTAPSIRLETAMIDAAGWALASVADRLPLEIGPEEVASAFLFEGRKLTVDIFEHTADVSVRYLLSHHDIEAFVKSRRPRQGHSQWDRARELRLTGSDAAGRSYLLDPGVNWFVQWLEKRGATTYSSREGHPVGFHIIFSAVRELAHAVAAVGPLVVEPVTLRHIPVPAGDAAGPAIPGLWLAYFPEGRSDLERRENGLRDLARRWATIAYPQEAGPTEAAGPAAALSSIHLPLDFGLITADA